MDPLFDFLCRLGDNSLVLGQRLSEWCGHAPVLEEDIALANISLDLIGQAQMWLELAAEVENKGRSADDLAMRRDAWEFRNLLLVEQPNGDFGHTIMRQFLFDAWHVEILSSLQTASDERIAAIAAKSVKEVQYHVQRSGNLVIGLGDGTDQSHARMQQALDILWPYVAEAITPDAIDLDMVERGIGVHSDALRQKFEQRLSAVIEEATLKQPDTGFAHHGGKSGARHSEHLGHLLAQMQWLSRAYSKAVW